jgi:serine/threonine protein kinase
MVKRCDIELNFSTLSLNPKTANPIINVYHSLRAAFASIVAMNEYEEHTSTDVSSNFSESDFTIIKTIGRGMIGKILLATKKDDGKTVVLKKMRKTDEKFDRKKVMKEVSAGNILEHNNIIQLLGTMETSDHFYLILEYVEGYDLFTFMKRRNFRVLSEQQAARIVFQLAGALIYSHSKGIIHRDIKLDNVLVDANGNVKLIDFGLCEIVATPNTLLQGWVGSLEYAAPEILLRTPYSGPKVDVWSLGVLFYSLLYGEFPFFAEDFLRTGCHPPIEWPDEQLKTPPTSCGVKTLLKKMLESNPRKRISMHDVYNDEYFCTLETQVAINATS